MPVKICENRTILGKEYKNVVVYKSDRPLTKKAKEQADELDRYLSKKMKEIELEMKSKNLLTKKHKKGVIELWYEVGKRLKFIEDVSRIPRDDRKYIWRALYDHAGELIPGKINVRVKYRPENSHFKYCYMIGTNDWEFVKKAGNWTAWVEFLDSPVIREDERIIEWLGSIQKRTQISLQDWLRALTKEIRRTLKNKDTSVYSPDELNNLLNSIFHRVYP